MSGRGYLSGRSGANGGDTARTLGNTTVGGSTRRNGGSYGGLDAFGNTEPTANGAYGSLADPDELGRGGGGGGRVAIYCEQPTSFEFANVLARGGGGLRTGADRTVYFLLTDFIPVSSPVPGLQIADINLAETRTDGFVPTAAGSSRAILLDCRTMADRRFVVETSDDLARWTAAPNEMEKLAPGRWRVTVIVDPGTGQFFRLRAAP